MHRLRRLAVLVPAMLVLPSGAGAQRPWTITGALAIAKDLRHDNGPTLGAVGIQLGVFPPSEGNWSWGGSLAYLRFGRFPFDFDPSFHADRSAFLAGVRMRRHGLVAPPIHGELGVALVLGREALSDGGVGHDGGIGGYAGLGVTQRRGRVRPFAELGVQGIAVMGEYTDTGGVSLIAALGLSVAI